MAVEKGNKVKIEYEGTLADGSVFDSSKNHGQPLEFEVGSGMVIKGFDDSVMGMEKDEEKTVTIEADNAYGQQNDQLIRKIPKDQMPAEIKEDMVIGVTLANGQQIPAKVMKIEESEVTLDLNHPLAGKDLTFKIKVVEIN